MKTLPFTRHSLRSHRAAFTLIELLVVLAIIGVLAGLLLPTLSRANQRARNTACLSQLRQLGLAVRAYADDFNNRLPSAELLPSQPASTSAPLPRISEVLAPYTGGRGGTNAGAPVFQCPLDKVGRYQSEGSSYEWNVALNGHRLDETRSTGITIRKIVVVNGEVVEDSEEQKELLFPPTVTPLFLDYEEFHPRPPKPGKNVVSMDGHAAGFEIPPN